MRITCRKMFTSFALVFCFVAAGTATVFAQRVNIPGHSNGSVRPPDLDRRESRSETAARQRSLTVNITGLEDADAQFRVYSGIGKFLSLKADAMKTEYEGEHARNPNLQVNQYLGAKLLVITAKEVRPDIALTEREVLDKWKECVNPRKVLESRGFTGTQAKKAYKNAMERLAQAKNSR